MTYPTVEALYLKVVFTQNKECGFCYPFLAVVIERITLQLVWKGNSFRVCKYSIMVDFKKCEPIL